MKRAIIYGASGLIGSYILEALLRMVNAANYLDDKVKILHWKEMSKLEDGKDIQI